MIAGRVSAGIVHDFELIEIQITQRMLAVAAACRVQNPAKALFEFSPIREAGQRIVACLVGELPRHAVGSGHVAAGSAVSLKGVGLVENGFAADGVHPQLTGGADNCQLQIVELTIALDLLAVCPGDLFVRADGREPLRVGESEQVLGRVTGDLVVALGQVTQAEIGIEFPEPVRGGLREVTKTLFAPAQPFFRTPALRHVDDGALNGRCAVPLHDADDVLQGYDGAVFAYRVELVLAGRGLAAHAGLHVAAAAFALVGGNVILHAAQRHQLLGRVVAEDGGVGTVEEQRRPVPVDENPLDRALDEVAEAVLAVLELYSEFRVRCHQWYLR